MDKDIPRGQDFLQIRGPQKGGFEIFSLSGRPCGGEASQPEMQLASVIEIHCHDLDMLDRG